MTSNVNFKVDEADIAFEEELLHSSHSVKSWLRYLDHKKGASPGVRNMLYER